MAEAPAADPHRKQRLKLQAVLLVAWFVLSFVLLFFARDLQFSIAGWPFNYWFAAQGGVLAFVAILAIYAAVMRRIDPEPDPEWPEAIDNE